MAADDGARARRQLARLISYQGRAKVREILGVDEDTLTSLLDGSLDWPADARERFDRAWGLMVMLGAPEEEPDEVDEAPGERITDGVDQAGEVENLAPAPGLGGDGNPVAGAEQPVVDPKLAAAAGGEMTPGSGGAVRTVVDAKPDAVVPREGVDHRRQTAAAAAISAADEQLQDLWWNAHGTWWSRSICGRRASHVISGCRRGPCCCGWRSSSSAASRSRCRGCGRDG